VSPAFFSRLTPAIPLLLDEEKSVKWFWQKTRSVASSIQNAGVVSASRSAEPGVDQEVVAQSGPSSRNVAAYHESGHAVARLIHGLTFSRAWVADDGTGGVVVGNSPPGQHWGASIRALAGPVAEARRTGQPLDEILTSQAGSVDRQHAEAALAAAGRTMAQAVEVAEKLTTFAWPALCAIAEILDANGEIRPPRCIAIMNGCLDDITD
jgi:hypothetical protein